jgi:hypothetical protein
MKDAPLSLRAVVAGMTGDGTRNQEERSDRMSINSFPAFMSQRRAARHWAVVASFGLLLFSSCPCVAQALDSIAGHKLWR